MKDLRIYEFNGYAYNDKRIRYRAVAIREKWRLAVANPNGCDWDFVNNMEYDTPLEALSIIDTL